MEVDAPKYNEKDDEVLRFPDAFRELVVAAHGGDFASLVAALAASKRVSPGSPANEERQ